MSEHVDTLKSLHTALIDSRNGYEEALKDADGKGLTPLFRDMIALRNSDAAALGEQLVAMGEKFDGKGSFMTAVHRTVIGVRSLFTGLDESILPGLIDGEERIVGYYDDAIQASDLGASERATLVNQRKVLQAKIADMRQRKEMAA